MKFRDLTSGKTFVRKVRRVSDEPGHAYELTFSCFHRFRFLEKDRARHWFVDAMTEARTRLKFDLWAYVIMPEHVHLIVYRGESGASPGQIRGKIKELAARPAIAYLTTHAPEFLAKITVREGSLIRRRFWQPGGGCDRNVIQVETAQKMIDYIHANPVLRKLVERPTDWEWSVWTGVKGNRCSGTWVTHCSYSGMGVAATE
jgi:putative transposase